MHIRRLITIPLYFDNCYVTTDINRFVHFFARPCARVNTRIPKQLIPKTQHQTARETLRYNGIIRYWILCIFQGGVRDDVMLPE